MTEIEMKVEHYKDLHSKEPDKFDYLYDVSTGKTAAASFDLYLQEKQEQYKQDLKKLVDSI